MKFAIFLVVLLATATATDWVKCAKSALTLGQDIAQLVEDAKTKDVKKIVQDLQTILADIQTLKTDCGIGEFTPEEFERVMIEIDNQGFDTDWVQCAKAALQLGQDVAQLVEDAKSGDIKVIVQDLQTILADIQTLTTDCGIGLTQINTDWIKCAKTLVSLTKDVAKLVVDAKSYNVPAIIRDLQNILADIQSLKKSCGIKTALEQFNLDDVNRDWVKCGKDAVELGKIMLQLKKDVTSKDIKAIVADLQNLLATINAIKADCF